MATYTGNIRLIDMSEIAEAGVLYTWMMYSDDPFAENPIITTDSTDKKYIGIAYNQEVKDPSLDASKYSWTLFKGENGKSLTKTKNYYAISLNGVTPPIDTQNLTIIDGQLYLVENGEISLVINGNFLTAETDEGQEIPLGYFKGLVTGVGAEWFEDIPEVPQGYYLWVKTVSYYSDESTTVQFLSGYQGKDGEQGQDANKFKFKFNQNEIIKFVKDGNLDVKTSISPENLIITITEDDVYNQGESKQVRDLNLNNFSLELYIVTKGTWYTIDNSMSITDEPFITIDQNDNFNVNLNLLIEQGSLTNNSILNSLVEEECILKFVYHHQTPDIVGVIQTYPITDFINIRYGISRDMATLQVGAKDIVASIQNSKLAFSAEGLSITNGGFKIIDNEGKEVLYCDNNGNVVMCGELKAATGTFAGELQAASGSFKGRVEAEEGYFKGHIEAESGTFKGHIEAESGTIGGFHIEGNHLASTAKDTINNIQGISKLYLDGEEGYIETADIRLTGTMTINDSIVLKKPTNSTDSFITQL